MSRIIIDSNGRPYMSNGKVLTVDASIDQNIQAGNIKKDVNIMGVTGTYEGGKPEETFSQTYTTNGTRTLTPSSGKVFSGGTINVNVQPNLQSKTVSPTKAQQTVTPDSGKDGLSSVVVNAVTSAIDSNITAGNIKKNVAILGVTGTYVSPMQSKSVSPTTSQQTVSPDSGYDGLSSVTVGAVTSAIDSNIAAGNIKKDVTILGVTGTYEGGGGGMAIQANLAIKTQAKTSLTATGLSLVVEKTGTYKISWAAFRQSTTGTASTRVYAGGSAKGTDHTSWTNSYGQQVTETGIALTAGQTVEVYSRSGSTTSTRNVGVMNLVIEQTA